MRSALEVISLEELGIVRMRGADAVKFLQGQLSNDVARLSAKRSLLAGYHNPQGRTIALLRLVQWDVDDILAIVPRELATGVASRLGKFVLRAKAKITDDSAAWRVSGIVGEGNRLAAFASTIVTAASFADDGTAGAAGPVGVSPAAVASTIVGASEIGAQVRVDGAAFVRVSDEPPRWLAISPADAPSPALDFPATDLATWQRLEVAAGLPQVYAATSEEFVAQMLNLDALNAIAFDKGCYTGQEVIARAHYRGRVKRRMQRFVSREPCKLSPGDSAQLADGRNFKVVAAAQLDDGRCDFLAVAPMTAAGGDATAPATGSPGAGSTASVTTQAVHPEAPPITDPTAPPVAGPIVDPTLAPIAAASVAPSVAAAAALSAAGAQLPSERPAIASGATSAVPPAAIVSADQATLPYPLPD